jgi:hypothetical protein
MDEEINAVIRRAELKRYLNEDELTFSDIEREEILVERKLLEQGVLRERDLVIRKNREMIKTLARKNLNPKKHSRIYRTFLVISVIWLIITLAFSENMAGFTEDFPRFLATSGILNIPLIIGWSVWWIRRA